MATNSIKCCCTSGECAPAGPSRGVVYFLRDISHLERFAVSIFSLRSHYHGPVCVVAEGMVQGHLPSLAKVFNFSVVAAANSTNRTYAAKVASLQLTPFEQTLFLDADTLVLAPIDPIFNYLSDSEFVFTGHNGWKNDRIGKKRLDVWRGTGLVPESMLDDALAYPFINIGVFAFRRNSPFLPRWLEISVRGEELGLGISDELAAQIFLPTLNATVIDDCWNWSGQHRNTIEGANIIHYHGNAHIRGPLAETYEFHLARLGQSHPEFFVDINSMPSDVSVEPPEAPQMPVKDILVYTIAFDAPGTSAYRTMAKFFASSLIRSGYNGDLIIFRNTVHPIFAMGRTGVRENFISTDAILGRDRVEAAASMKYLAASAINELPYKKIAFCDCDCLFLKPLQDIVEWDASIQYSEEQLPMGHNNFNGYLSDSERSGATRAGVNSGFWIVDSQHYRKLMRQWHSIAITERVHPNSIWGDQPAWNRVILDSTLKSVGFSRATVKFPALYDTNFLDWRNGSVLHFCGPGMDLAAKLEFISGVWFQTFYSDGAHVVSEILNF